MIGANFYKILVMLNTNCIFGSYGIDIFILEQFVSFCTIEYNKHTEL